MEMLQKTSLEAIHFDMDGVIADTEPFHVQAELQTCEDYKFDVNHDDWQGFKGRTARDIFRHLIDMCGDSNIHTVDELIEHKTQRFIEIADGHIAPIEGALDFIQWAKNNFKKTTLVTSSNRQTQEFIIGRYCHDRRRYF
jgi:beta-phosphoglucomutase